MGEFVKTTKGFRFIDENVKYMVLGMAQAGFICSIVGTVLCLLSYIACIGCIGCLAVLA